MRKLMKKKFNLIGIIDNCLQIVQEMFFEIKVKFNELPWNQGCFQNVLEFPFSNY